ncbi:MAG TPA: ABC transporter substrate-binding protein [Mycobacterium sp.]
MFESKKVRAIGMTLLAGALLAACGGVDSGSGSGGSTGSDGAAADGSVPGVTADTITLGHMTDLSGPFAPIGKEYLTGAQLFVSNKNAAGGVCGRKIELDIQDHGYNAQKAATLYTESSPKVLGYEAIIGSPMATAVLPSVEKDNIVMSPLTFEVSLLQTDAAVFEPGPTYEVSAANATAWAIEQNKLQPGDKIGMIVFEGAFGDNAEHGVDIAATNAGVEVVKTRIKPADTDFTGPVTTMRSEGAKIVVLGTGASQMSAILSTASSLGYDPQQWLQPNTGSFNAGLLDGPAAQTLLDKVVFASPGAVWSETDIPAVKELHTAYEAQKPDVAPGAGVVIGYAQAQAYTEIISKSCDNLTRAGLVEQFRATTALDTGGLLLPLDFTRGDGQKSPTLATNIVKPDKAAEGGLVLVEENYTSEAVKGSDL